MTNDDSAHSPDFSNNTIPDTDKLDNNFIEEAFGFIEAMTTMVKGNKVRRLSWPNPDDYCFLDTVSKQYWIHIEGKDHAWVIRQEDVEAEDWIIKLVS